MARKKAADRPPTVRQEPRADGTETIEEAAKKWPSMTPWPLPTPGHGNVGLVSWAESGADEREFLGGSESAADKLGIGPDVLLIHILQAQALREVAPIRQETVARHDSLGEFFLRAVPYKDGVLVGIVGSDGHTYCAAEWYETAEIEAGWTDWINTLNA